MSGLAPREAFDKAAGACMVSADSVGPAGLPAGAAAHPARATRHQSSIAMRARAARGCARLRGLGLGSG
jgi:hypothetical protein